MTLNWNRHSPIPRKMYDSPVSQAMADAWDGEDPWGSALAEAFALCDFVTTHLEADEEIPEAMGYQQAMAGADTDSYLYQSLVEGFEREDFTAADAFDYLPIVHTYIQQCVALSLDY